LREIELVTASTKVAAPQPVAEPTMTLAIVWRALLKKIWLWATTTR
jgi:hypothetical protein